MDNFWQRNGTIQDVYSALNSLGSSGSVRQSSWFQQFGGVLMSLIGSLF